MCGAVKPLFALPFYFLRLLQGWKSLNQSKRAAASVDEFHQLCDSALKRTKTTDTAEPVYSFIDEDGQEVAVFENGDFAL